MIGLLRGWTHFRPLSTTQRGYYARVSSVSIGKAGKIEGFRPVSADFGKLTVRLLSACEKGAFEKFLVFGASRVTLLHPLTE